MFFFQISGVLLPQILFENMAEYFELTIILVLAALIGVNIGKKWLKAMKNSLVHNLVMVGIIISGIFYLIEGLNL